MKTSFFQLLDSLKFAGISSQLLTILYFWGQTTTIFSLFSVVSDQIGLTSYFLTNLCLLNTPFLFYRLSMLTEKFMGIDLLFIASLLLTALLAVFISLLYVATRRYRLKIDKQQGNIEKVLKIVVYFFLVASISLAGMSSYEVYLLVQQQKEYLMIIPLLNLVLLIVIVYVSEETTC